MIFSMLMVVSLLGGTLLQAFLPGFRFLAGARWPFLCSVVLYYALNHRGGRSLICAFIAGVLMDALSMVPFGWITLFFILLVLVTGAFRESLQPDAWITSIFFGAVSGLLFTLFIYVLLLRTDWRAGRHGYAMVRVVGGMLTGAVTAAVVIPLLARLHKALDIDDRPDEERVNA